MARVFLTMVLPFLLPTAVYVGWAVAARRGGAMAAAPWPWLGGAGIVLVAVVLGLVTLHFGETGGRYVPAQFDKGEIVPGHFVPEAKPR